ncbi:dynamin family protein [Actinocrispum sp. NPDC049592]|uniref:dynamin family protein n=1 Tax=Actinocrispum sp. NPDC049592 TaxID=3154835 RepID=UPI003427D333
MPTATEVLDVAIKAASAYHRTDLASRLRQSRDRTLTQEVRVIVAGDVKQGKSQLVNALVMAPVCPVGDDVTTTVPTVVRYSGSPNAFLVHDDCREPVVLGSQVVSGGCVEAGLPREVLADGLTIVDTPGFGGLAALALADAVLFVSDASERYTPSELEFLAQARELCPNVIGVLTKIDLYPDWRLVFEADSEHIHTLIAVSSELRLHAAATGDASVHRESGFPWLVRFLRQGLVARAGDLALRSAAHDVLAVTAQLTSTMLAEVTAQRDASHARFALDEIARRADEVRQRSARWHQTLNDGITDLIADIEHDLRHRLREVLRLAESSLDTIDPARNGDSLASWLRDRETACVAATFAWMMERAEWLAEQVAAQFEGTRPSLHTTDSLAAGMPTFALAPAERFGFGQKVIVGMRGGYGGTLMIGMLSTIMGVAMINPVSVGAGLLLGGKTVREERERMLQRRQAEARTAIRKHIDDVIFHTGKQCRDLLREIQRTLRDHFTTQTETLQHTLADELAAARRALTTGQADRDARIRDLNAELRRVHNLERMARELLP